MLLVFVDDAGLCYVWMCVLQVDSPHPDSPLITVEMYNIAVGLIQRFDEMEAKDERLGIKMIQKIPNIHFKMFPNLLLRFQKTRYFRALILLFFSPCRCVCVGSRTERDVSLTLPERGSVLVFLPGQIGRAHV